MLGLKTCTTIPSEFEHLNIPGQILLPLGAVPVFEACSQVTLKIPCYPGIQTDVLGGWWPVQQSVHKYQSVFNGSQQLLDCSPQVKQNLTWSYSVKMTMLPC